MKTLKEKKGRPRLRKTGRIKKVTQRKASSGPVCLLCLREPGDPEKLGEFLQKDNLCVHYFCLDPGAHHCGRNICPSCSRDPSVSATLLLGLHPHSTSQHCTSVLGNLGPDACAASALLTLIF